MKEAGILLHISSLNSDFGIGDFGRAAYEFADFLYKSGQSLWQILPIGYTGLGNSPYQCYSSRAISPYFINPEEFVETGLCEESFIDRFRNAGKPGKVEYNKIFKTKDLIFDKAFDSFDITNEEYIKFKDLHAGWLDDFAIFIILLKKTKNLSIREFDKEIIELKQENLLMVKKNFSYEIERECFLQFIAFRQWFKLKKYVNELHIKIIGDIPIYLSLDSVEVWKERELFNIYSSIELTQVSGVPPDKLSNDGQIWNNPLYNWKYHKKTKYSWWIERIQFALNKFDIIRLDHFRGFAKYYAVKQPFNDAHQGRWIKGPGYNMFKIVNSLFENNKIIAEDLGHITRDVRKLKKRTGYAGMKVAQFGFDGSEDNEHLPKNYGVNYYAYSGTHDNNTLLGWLNELDDEEYRNLKKFYPISKRDDICALIIEGIMKSAARAVIIPMQDYLELDGSSRMNTPSTVVGNWEWRMTEIPEGLNKKVRSYTAGRRN